MANPNGVVAQTAAAQQISASMERDPKYKKYLAQVERCLNSFDNVHEWADCIAFLKQLLKTFQSYMQFKEIPRKLIVAKRLSQCLNPALPTGVHQRALDVYSHILAVLGSEGLKRDLAIWSSGLFPFFEYAATSVKPSLLNLYDTHYLPLQAGLRPVMKSFILALLPGLEEETGEFFEKVLALLDRLSGTVSSSFFLQNIWLVMLTTPSARGTALNFLSRRLPQLHGLEDITSVVGSDIGLMIRAFAAALEDENLLVRRSALDLLLQSMRMDSNAVKRAQPDDRTILMRAAVSVVLRRDLSLNRRLYSWLLGPAEKSEKQQIEYLKTNALELLRNTLKEDMVSPSGEYSESRPFKIFISLLDNWEIGAALSDVLVYDAFKAIKALTETGTEEDVSMTANTLYDAVEPHIIWRRLLTTVFQEIVGHTDQFEAIDMVLFILRTFSQDEEAQTVHFPLMFSAVMDLLDIQLKQDPSKASSPAIKAGLSFLEVLLRQIPHIKLLSRPEVKPDMQAVSENERPYIFACTFYDIKPVIDAPAPTGTYQVPFSSAFESLASLSMVLGISLTKANGNLTALREVFTKSLALIERLVSRLNSSITLVWEPKKWLEVILNIWLTVSLQNANFTVLDKVVSLIVLLHQTVDLTPNFSIDDRSIMSKMVNRLMLYLRPDYAVYHVRAVNLIWSLEAATPKSHVESILAQTMNSPESRNVQESYEAFGALWRLTEDNMLPGSRFKVPMMIVLDTLKNEDPNLRRIGETWMRCSLKSYIRVLDPILFELLDPSIRRSMTTVKVKGKEIPGFVYERPFDQRYMNHLMEMLASVIRIGGQGFVKTARISGIKRSHHTGLVNRVESAGFPDPDVSYLEVLLHILLNFLQSEPKTAWAPTMDPQNLVIQSTAVDLLQAIVSRGEIQGISIEVIEAAVIGKLYFCIHVNRLNLQNKLLHLLHSVISASIATDESSRRITVGKQRPDQSLEPLNTGEGDDSIVNGYSVNPLLTQTLVDGIATPTNQPVLQHWLDFVLMAVPQFQPTLQTVVGPLNDCVVKKLIIALRDLLKASATEEEFSADIHSANSDAEFNMLLNGLERLVLLGLAYTSEVSVADDDASSITEKNAEGSGLLGYVSNVFSSDNTQQSADEQLRVRSPAYYALNEGVRILYLIWGTLGWTDPEDTNSRDESLALIYNRTRTRSRRVLEHIFRVQSAEVFESIVDCWNRDMFVRSLISDDAPFELIDVLVSSAQNVVHMICESISLRASSSDKKKQAINPDLTDMVLFNFLEQYLQRLEGPLALQVWGRFLQLAKEIAGSTREFKPQTFSTLRCATVLAEKITQTTAMEDRRIRKDLQSTWTDTAGQDIFSKLLDSCVGYVGKTYGSSSWIRRSANEALLSNGRDSPTHGSRDGKLDEKMNASTVSFTPDTPRPGAANEAVTQINEFIAAVALPNMRRILMDNDKVSSACTNIVYYIISPLVKGKVKPMEVDPIVVNMIYEMSRIPSTFKAWRSPVTELLNDSRVFNGAPEAAEAWKPIIKTVFDSDKTAFPELLNKISTAPSANIFTNREYEMLVRSLNLRRLSFVLLAGEKNHYLTVLPSIQEKLVDVLRNTTAPIVQSEVYLCIRVLLCRLSPHNLTSFWPVLLTELYRIFEQVMLNLPSDGSEDLPLVLAACKCLDLLIAIQTEEFQIHQWMFVTDTVDAIYRPNDWFPEAMMDQLAEIAGSLPRVSPNVSSSISHSPAPNLSGFGAQQKPMRRPMLTSVRQIDSIRDLVPFFSGVSITTYESVYASNGSIDWDVIEKGIMDDMFDGR
ncbi:Dopey, N-terminal-domain-containing protein [Rhodocollybia butyracea]|uniref:Dopey, N-terminal-domain-containing protein n=1 Tax=Rhodocollybia butyracea TaxID=206335 RepID=A0A9P5U507_9AGAR|nr:Dopey, N-terminal-domain-containing protein [Rhodocollybia butyracea]